MKGACNGDELAVRAALGDAMSLNVLMRVLGKALFRAGLLDLMPFDTLQQMAGCVLEGGRPEAGPGSGQSGGDDHLGGPGNGGGGSGAQAGLDAAQTEVRRSAELRPELTTQDLEVIGALRGMVSSTGMPKALLTALFNAIANQAAAAGPAAGQAPGGGFGGHAVIGAQAYSPACSPTSAATAGALRQLQHVPLGGRGAGAGGGGGLAHGCGHAGLLARGGNGAGSGAAGAGRPDGPRRGGRDGGQAAVEIAPDLAVAAVRHSWVGAAAWCLAANRLTVLEGVNRAQGHFLPARAVPLRAAMMPVRDGRWPAERLAA